MSESMIYAFSFQLLRKIYLILNKKYYYLPKGRTIHPFWHRKMVDLKS